MLRGIWHSFSVMVLVFLSACAPITMNQFIAEGKSPLSEEQLRELVNNHVLHLEAIDFDARIDYRGDGRLNAISLQGEEDTGKWVITSSHQLCMKFDLWYYGDQRCYTVFKDIDQYVFFTSNGARYYTGATVSETAPQRVATDNASENRSHTDRQPHTVPAMIERTSVSREQALVSLARNCPDCKLVGVDLRGAQLIAANLAGADLSEADLTDANLRRANLTGANLSGAKLTRSNLAGADLTNSNLRDADLTGCNLIRANVSGADLEGAVLSGAHLESIQGLKK
ncbi:MAG: pentapeptide repeat-containing protein [Desulforhopalus sp.]